VFIPWAAEWIHKSLTAIFQGVNHFFSRTFERLFAKKQRERRRSRGCSEVKCPEFEGKIRCYELYPFHEIIGVTLILLELVPRTENSQEIIENRDFSDEQICSCDRRYIEDLATTFLGRCCCGGEAVCRRSCICGCVPLGSLMRKHQACTSVTANQAAPDGYWSQWSVQGRFTTLIYDWMAFKVWFRLLYAYLKSQRGHSGFFLLYKPWQCNHVLPTRLRLSQAVAQLLMIVDLRVVCNITVYGLI